MPFSLRHHNSLWNFTVEMPHCIMEFHFWPHHTPLSTAASFKTFTDESGSRMTENEQPACARSSRYRNTWDKATARGDWRLWQENRALSFLLLFQESIVAASSYSGDKKNNLGRLWAVRRITLTPARRDWVEVPQIQKNMLRGQTAIGA